MAPEPQSVTIELFSPGPSPGSATDLHALQAAFLEHDAFQCGYCTPGQICSGAGLLAKFEAGWPSQVSEVIDAAPMLTRAEIVERMSGNICRGAAYPNIIDAIVEVAEVAR
jgi:xanthine dehydrogenase YagT iron-sulfur-binding subunit